MRILVAQDDPAGAFLLERALGSAGHRVILARSAAEAKEAIGVGPFDALLTDWVMPRTDGFDLIRHVRNSIRPAPLILVVTALASEDERARALEAGADDYVAKPYAVPDVLTRLGTLFSRRGQPSPARAVVAAPPASPARPPFVAVVIAASTGGPRALSDLFHSLGVSERAAFFVVLHGPPWMLETFAHRLQRETAMKVLLAGEGVRAAPGTIYLAPGDRHLCLDPSPPTLRLRDDPPENFVRPAADPLFRSAATAFGRHCVALIMSGMGRDGATGSEHVAASGGLVMAQDPDTAVARSMPQTVIDLGLAREVAPVAGLASALGRHIESLSAALGAVSIAPRRGGPMS